MVGGPEAFDLAENAKLAEVVGMEQIGLEHHYAEHPGAHDWEWERGALPLVSWTASEIEAMAA